MLSVVVGVDCNGDYKPASCLDLAVDYCKEHFPDTVLVIFGNTYLHCYAAPCTYAQTNHACYADDGTSIRNFASFDVTDNAYPTAPNSISCRKVVVAKPVILCQKKLQRMVALEMT